MKARHGRDCVRATIEPKRWSKHHQNFRRVAARYESPARKCRVQWNKCASPVGTTRALTHTLKPNSSGSHTAPAAPYQSAMINELPTQGTRKVDIMKCFRSAFVTLAVLIAVHTTLLLQAASSTDLW